MEKEQPKQSRERTFDHFRERAYEYDTIHAHVPIVAARPGDEVDTLWRKLGHSMTNKFELYVDVGEGQLPTVKMWEGVGG